MATIGKSFSDPDKWENAWFACLDADQKLLFMYMWDRCDHVGVLEFIPNVWSAHTDLKIDMEFVQILMERINGDKERLVITGRKFWFPKYIRYNQQPDPEKPLSAKHPFHKHIWKRAIQHDLVDEINQRDPILLKEFISSSDYKTNTSEANVRHSKGISKSTGRGNSNGSGCGSGTSMGEGIGRDSNSQDLLSDNEKEELETFSP